LGGQLAAAGSAAKRDEGIAAVRELMRTEKLSATDIDAHAEDIYNAVKEFIDNTDFSVSFTKPY
jgi:hypothetical protein